jgi:hypothetical protein
MIMKEKKTHSFEMCSATQFSSKTTSNSKSLGKNSKTDIYDFKSFGQLYFNINESNFQGVT